MTERSPQPKDELVDLKGRYKVVESCDGKAVGGGWVVWTKESSPNASTPYKVKWNDHLKRWEAFDGKYQGY